MKMESDRPVITDGIVQILLSDPGKLLHLSCLFTKRGTFSPKS